jgi:hypothetical protein
MKKLFVLCLLLAAANILYSSQVWQIKSPSGEIAASVKLSDSGNLSYSLSCNGKSVLEDSPLSIAAGERDYASGLKIIDAGKNVRIDSPYIMLTGKRKACHYIAEARTLLFENESGKMALALRVSDDGLAFRYEIPEGNDASITYEATGFSFADDTVAFLHPMNKSKSGWARTQFSYEEYYSTGKCSELKPPFGQGWSYPALFNTSNGCWALVSESNTTAQYCGTHLSQKDGSGEFAVAFAQPEDHRGSIDPVNPQVSFPFASPWRIVIAGDELGDIVESTLASDVAEENILGDCSWVKPGRAAWHWLQLDDDSCTIEYQKQFLEMAVQMGWEYVLVDALWDEKIGYEKIAEFAAEASEKGVGVILWYNSNGGWNDAPQTPKNRMHEAGVRREEFARIAAMGVKGVKIDFFGGDKQASMQLYLDILKDAADHKIAVNFHGATLPRGWQRTYPNLVTTEAVRGMEYCTFSQDGADKQAQHCAMLPFTRNVVSSMDFTPLVVEPHVRGVVRKTTLAFELALPVVFESGIQHLGLVPDEIPLLPDYALAYLKDVPTVFDEIRFVEGYPGKYAVIARRLGEKWYVGIINGTDTELQITPDLSFIRKGIVIEDAPDAQLKQERLTEGKRLTIQPRGGAVVLSR